MNSDRNHTLSQRAARPSSRSVIAILCCLIALAGVPALFVYLWGQAHSVGSALGLTLDSDGKVQIVTRQCPGRGIGKIVIRRAADGVLVFAAQGKQGANLQTSISVDAASDESFDKALPLGPLDGAALYEVATLDDHEGWRIDSSIHRFHPMDLRHDGIIAGLDSAGQVPQTPTPVPTFKESGISCP